MPEDKKPDTDRPVKLPAGHTDFAFEDLYRLSFDKRGKLCFDGDEVCLRKPPVSLPDRIAAAAGWVKAAACHAMQLLS